MKLGEEYFIRFNIIRAVKDHVSKKLVFTSTPNPNDPLAKYIYLCDKVMVGETLMQAIERSLKVELGVNKVINYYLLDISESATNKYGELLSRSVVNVEVEYREITVKLFQKWYSSWVDSRNSIRSIIEEIKFSKEILPWLKNNSHPSPIAGNRFRDKQEVLDFVNRLYSAGAKEIRVYDVDQEPEGEYSSNLLVIMPWDQDQRKKIFEISNEENIHEGYKPENDNGEEALTFWWD